MLQDAEGERDTVHRLTLHPRRNADLAHELADHRPGRRPPAATARRVAVEVQLVGGLGLRVEEPLAEAAAELVAAPQCWRSALDALGDHAQLELLGHREDRGDDRAVVAALT